jgi:hypothetical protein
MKLVPKFEKGKPVKKITDKTVQSILSPREFAAQNQAKIEAIEKASGRKTASE